MTAPPFLEFEIARRLGIDFGVEVVLLRPVGIGRVEIFKVSDKPGAVEFAVAEIAHERRKPTPAEHAAGIAHRVLSPSAGPIGEWRPCDYDRTEQLGP